MEIGHIWKPEYNLSKAWRGCPVETMLRRATLISDWASNKPFKKNQGIKSLCGF